MNASAVSPHAVPVALGLSSWETPRQGTPQKCGCQNADWRLYQAGTPHLRAKTAFGSSATDAVMSPACYRAEFHHHTAGNPSALGRLRTMGRELRSLLQCPPLCPRSRRGSSRCTEHLPVRAQRAEWAMGQQTHVRVCACVYGSHQEGREGRKPGS